MSDRNGTAPPAADSLAALRAELEEARIRHELATLRAEEQALTNYLGYLGERQPEPERPRRPVRVRSVAEAIYARTLQETYYGYASYTGDGWGALVDPLDAYTDVDGFLLPSAGLADRRTSQSGFITPFVRSENELRMVQAASRILCDLNPFAIGVVNTLRTFVIGRGFRWKCVARPRSDCPDGLAGRVQDWLEGWFVRSRWRDREKEACVRRVRDGEFFLRLFDEVLDGGVRTGECDVRFVEPEYVTGEGAPEEYAGGVDCWSWGIRTAPGDAEHHLGYNLRYHAGRDSEQAPAADVVHVRGNVDLALKRGVPDFAPVADILEGTRKLIRNLREGGAVQAAIAGIWEYTGTPMSQVQGGVTAMRDQQRAYQPNPITGRATNYAKYEPGSFIHGPASRQYKPLQGAGQNVPQHVATAQACLRAAAVRWGLPEFMISGDASNNNYASILVAGSPFVRAVECEQDVHDEAFQRVIRRALAAPCRAGRFRVGGEPVPLGQLLAWVDVQGEAPTPVMANKQEDAQVNNTQHQAGVLSATTWQQRDGLDPEREAANFAREKGQGQQGQQAPGPDGLPPGAGLTAEGKNGSRAGVGLAEEMKMGKDRLGRRFCTDGGKRVPCPAEPGPGARAPARPTADEVRSHIERVRGAPTAAGVAGLAAALSRMTVSQLQAVKKELGLWAGGAKPELARKIAEQATRRLTEREHWAREARKAGVRPADLHATMRDVHRLGRDYVGSVASLVRDARRLYAADNPGKVLTRSHRAFRGGDMHQIAGFDTMSRTLAGRYPELLGAHGYDHSDAYDPDSGEAASRLYDFLNAGTPAPPARADSYRQALEYLADVGTGATTRPRKKAAADAGAYDPDDFLEGRRR